MKSKNCFQIPLLLQCWIKVWLVCGLWSCARQPERLVAKPEGKLPGYPQLGLAYPPYRDAKQRHYVLPLLRDLEVSHIRIGDSWKWREPMPGAYRWDVFEKKIAFAKTNGLKILLTVNSDGPEWAMGDGEQKPRGVITDLDAFERYAQELAKRSKGVVTYVQFSNEWVAWNQFPGTAEDYLHCHRRLAKAFRTYAPNTKIVLGSLSTGTLRALAAKDGKVDEVVWGQKKRVRGLRLKRWLAGNDAQRLVQRLETVLESAEFDMLDVHLYHDIENWPHYVAALQSRAPGKPILCSEFGGPNLFLAEATPDAQAKHLAASLDMLESLPIETAYYFKLHFNPQSTPGHRNSSLLFRDRSPKPAYEIFKQRAKRWNTQLSSSESPASSR